MEVLAVLITMAFSTAPIAIIGGVLLYTKHLAERRNRVWSRVARTLGLHYVKDCVWGTLDGHEVQLRTEYRGSGKSRHLVTVIAAGWSPPLDLGLHITQHAFLHDAIAGLFGQKDVVIGDPELDRMFTIQGDEPARIARALTPPLRQLMMAMARSGNEFHLTDSGFSMTRRGGVELDAWLVWALRAAAHVAHWVEKARPGVPAAWLLQPHQLEWTRFASDMGLSWMSTPLCIWGRLGGVNVSAYAVRAAERTYQIEVLVRFEQSLGVGLLVRPSQALDGLAAIFGGQDLVLGDGYFDAAFVVQASDPRRIGEILDREVRARALELHQRVGRVQIRDDGITLRSLSPSGAPGEVPRLVDALKALAEQIHQNAIGRGAKAGPYR
jgi:hypothetical protein